MKNEDGVLFMWFKSYQDVSLQEQAGFNRDADAGVAVSLHVAAIKQ